MRDKGKGERGDAIPPPLASAAKVALVGHLEKPEPQLPLPVLRPTATGPRFRLPRLLLFLVLVSNYPVSESHSIFFIFSAHVLFGIA